MNRTSCLSTGFAVITATALFCLGTGVQTSAAIRINEFSASNSDGLKDSNGVASDWIELFNDGDSAVNLGGCYLSDSPSQPTRWKFPTPTTIPAQGYLIVFADSTLTAPVSGRELHANFSLSKTGEYLALVDKDGTSILDEISPQYPEQYSDISYGVVQAVSEYVSNQTTNTWTIPAQNGVGTTGTGVGSVGFTETEGGGSFTVSYWHLNVSSINSTSEAETYIKNRSYWRTDASYPIVGSYPTLNFAGNDSNGHYSPDTPFPAHTSTAVDKDGFVVLAEANILIPRAGMWTFGGMSDDGFSLKITGNGVNFVCEYTGARSMSDTLASFNFPTAGTYSVRMIYFESGGGAGLELYAAEGNYGSWGNNFRLVGDTAKGGLSTEGAIASSIDTNIENSLKGTNSRIDVEYAFDVEKAPNSSASLTFGIRYADGFLATLNGTRIASANTPATMAWNAQATQTRKLEDILVWGQFPVALDLLKEGKNVLKVVGLNNSSTDPEFLIQPTLTLVDNSELNYRYFTTPTPSNANGQGFLARTAPVEFSQPRGYYDSPFVLELSCLDADAQIRYTLDGSEPSQTNGTAYTAPLTLNKTTTLRAISYKPSHIASEVHSRTWIFLDSVFKQSSSAPAGWPSSRSVNSHVMVYGMNSSITESPTYSERLREGFKDIPTLSLVTDLDNLFDAQTGIYVNPGNSGETWERPVSVELIDPQGGEEFQINAGLRIRGAASRTSDNPKHSFRLFFRGKYGESKLLFPLFGKEGTSEFDKVDLRTEQNHSWHREAPDSYTAVREVFARDTQRDSGTQYTRSRYYHLFLNGLYWGLYMTQERVDADYAISYMGGIDTDWDCIKTESSSGRATVAGDGNMDAWQALYNITTQGYGVGKEANYYKVRGLNPDGTRNPNYPILLDQDNLIKFMINAYYTGDPDNPRSLFINAPNNLFALYNHTQPDGFKWFRHDAEHSLASNDGDWGINMDYTAAGWGYSGYSQFEPMLLHQALSKNAEYVMRFADIVQEQFFDGGILTPESCIARYQARMNQIDRAVIGESARWGATMGTLRTRDVDWLNENNYMLKTYFPQRTAIVLQQFKNQKWFPQIDAPASTLTSGMCDPGEEITLSAEGAFYYTLDGSDPRLPGGKINPNAILVNSSGSTTPVVSPQTLIAKKSFWKYYDLGTIPSTAGSLSWRALAYTDSSWNGGTGVFGFGTREDVTTPTTRTTDSGVFVTTTYFRNHFTLNSLEGITGLKLSLRRDDGAIIYLNGTEIHRENMPAGTPTFDTFSSGTVDSTGDNVYFDYTLSAEKLRVGANVIAVEVHQCNGTSSDMYFDLELSTLTNGSQEPSGATSTTVAINENTTLLMRSYINGVWSALNQFKYLVRQDYDLLRISEMMHSPALNEGDTGTYDDYAWLEICNTSTQSVNMQDVRLSEGIEYTFPSVVVPAGGYLVLAKNADMFATRYDTNGMILLSGYEGNLARKGETVTLVAPDALVIQSFAYERNWHPEADRSGYSLEVINLEAPLESWSHPYNWYPSAILGGTPGYAARLVAGCGDQVVLANESATLSLGDFEGTPENLQWLHFNTRGKWEAVAGATSSTLTLEKVGEKSAGLYMARFDLEGYTTLSTPAELMVVLSQPANATAMEGESASLSLEVAAIIPEKLQWQKFTSANQWEDILEATGSTLTLNYISGNDAGLYRVRLYDQWVSQEATLQVQTETVPPTLVGIEATSSTYLKVTFSEYVSTETALNLKNYTLDNGAKILNVAVTGETVTGGVKNVLLETSALASGSVYSLTVNNISDISSNKNPIAPNSIRYIQTESAGQGLLRQVWYNCSGTIGSMTGKSTYPNRPDLETTVSEFKSPIDWGDNYGQKISGLIIPPVTGSYTFWVCSDDDSELWLSTDETPSNKKRIAFLSGWAPVDSWENYASQKSASITLQANTAYYIEGLQADGTGGDHLIVRWQLPSGSIENPIPVTHLYMPNTVFTAPEIVVQPRSISCYEGESVSFEPFVNSSTPATYNWEIDGTFDPTQTERILTLNNVTLADNGKQVRCSISNLNGSVLSARATLTVLSPLEKVTLVTQPQGGTLQEGQTLTLSVTATGSAPLTYQWYRDGLAVGENANTLVVSEAGKYKVTVSNALGSQTSNEVEVTVESTPSEPPTLTLVRGTSDELVIRFQGRLQSCSSLEAADWVEIATESPARVTPTDSMKFFRAVR